MSQRTNQLLLHLLGSSPHLSSILSDQETSVETNPVTLVPNQRSASSHVGWLL